MVMGDDVEMEVDGTAAAVASDIGDEVVEERVFVVHEVDFDYEYDAPMFFDFGRAECAAEALAAESWFGSAASYPPSPFVVKLNMRDQMLNVNVSPKSKIMQHDDDNVDALCGVGDAITRDQAFFSSHEGVAGRMGIFINQQNMATVAKKPGEFCGGLRLGHGTFQQKVISQAKSSAKLARPRSSTLMKPTASQLAKQNKSSKVVNSSHHLPLGKFSGKGLCSSGAESQAVKRQKLDGGELCKVFEVQQQADFVHKASSKKDEVVEKNCRLRLRITIPREPDLATANRAQRTRTKTISEEEQADVTVRRFKARPLNRKIFEAPILPLKKSNPRLPEFQVFHLRTQERAIQHNPATSTTLTLCQNSEKRVLPSCSLPDRDQKNSQRVDEMDLNHTFKARPLDKKEFKFNNEKRLPQTPPIDLFNRLSINSELQSSNICHTQMKTPQPSWLSSKAPKENRFRFLPLNNEIITPVKSKLPRPSGSKQLRHGSEQAAGERCAGLSSRNLGLW
ncbi:hypothetical protein MLD38_036564 [Melastoma candidum]|uniref:Uncharacterized protein n=1 Tax=Melastoma candidum TaxID=119954 RepID=A0ACB9LKS5_9MYRT|nr:hypothetical protein MLD38_036564 [Melastoma candidum]